jgi:hypothetical protein
MPLAQPDGYATDHEVASTCWCQPVADQETPEGRIVLHRRYIDGPARDPDDDKGWVVVERESSPDVVSSV